MKRILFYFFKNVHVPVLVPIMEELKQRKDTEIGVCVPFEGYNRSIRAGVAINELAQIPMNGVTRIKNPSSFNADAVFIADAVTDLVQKCGKIINVGHGLLSKGQYFTNTSFTNRENLQDLLIVPGTFHREQLRKSNKVFIPVAAAGYPKLDILYSKYSLTREELCIQGGLDPSKKIILYTPTFNIALSTIPILWTRIRHLVNDDTFLIIKLHGSTLPEFVSAHKEMAKTVPNIFFIEGSDITPYLQVADVMISDVSSAFMEFILLNKPVVLFNNPNVKEYINYDPNDIEYQWRDVGLQVSSLEETRDAVYRSLDNPMELSERRQEVISKLGIPLDGKASARVIDLMNELLEYGLKRLLFKPKERCALYITGNDIPQEQLFAYVTELLNNCGEEPIIIVYKSSISDFDEIAFATKNIVLIEFENLKEYLHSFDFVAMVKYPFVCGDKWLFRFFNHLRRSEGFDRFVPLMIGSKGVQDPFNLLLNPNWELLPDNELDINFMNGCVGEANQVGNEVSNEVVAFKGNDIEALEGLLTEKHNELNFLLTLDVVMWITDNLTSVDHPAEIKRIDELEAAIKAEAMYETPEEKVQRLRAEELIKSARHFMARANYDQAEKFAQNSLMVYPEAKSAQLILKLIEEIRKIQNTTVTEKV